jgi:hypothetical protein
MNTKSRVALAGWCVVAVAASMAVPLAAARAQSHRPAVIEYLVRDEAGKLLDPAKLEVVATKKGEEMKPDTALVPGADGKRETVKCLSSRVDIGGRPVALSELTLKYGGKTMRLLFNVTVVEEHRTIDSLPFREGTFTLKDNKWIEAAK